MANDRQRPSADQAESDNNTSDTDVVAALHAFEPLAAVTDNDQTVVPEITRLLASLKKFMSNVGLAQSKSGLPEADGCGRPTTDLIKHVVGALCRGPGSD